MNTDETTARTAKRLRGVANRLKQTANALTESAEALRAASEEIMAATEQTPPQWKPEVGGTVETMRPDEWLDAVRADLDAATPGPWEATTSEATMNNRSGYRFGELVRPAVFLANQMRHQDAALIASAPERMDRMERALRAVLALAVEWDYGGEFGWDDGSHAYGPDPEGEVLDHASEALVRAITTALLGEVEA